MSNKYGAKPVVIDDIRFDSTFEGTVYELLKKFYVPCQIRCHHPIAIAPASNRFPAWNWKVDFYLPESNLLIEAKGVRTDEWTGKLRALDSLNPKVLDRLIVVGARKGEQICKGLYTVSLADLAQYLQRMTQR